MWKGGGVLARRTKNKEDWKTWFAYPPLHSQKHGVPPALLGHKSRWLSSTLPSTENTGALQLVHARHSARTETRHTAHTHQSPDDLVGVLLLSCLDSCTTHLSQRPPASDITYALAPGLETRPLDHKKQGRDYEQTGATQWNRGGQQSTPNTPRNTHAPATTDDFHR